MAWEWVAPAGTAAVGVTSVLTTLAVSRSAQRREERAAARSRAYSVEDALRAERKEMFLAFLTAVAALEASAMAVRSAGPADEVANAALNEARDVLANKRIEIALIAGAEVSTLCGEVVQLALPIVQAVRTDPAASALVDGTVLARVVKAMAQELRIDVPAVG